MTESASGRDMLDTVRKLLAKAEGTANEAERDTYNEKAAALIAKYGIDQALLNATRAETEREVVGDRIVHVPAPYAAEKSALLHNVAVPLRVHTVRRSTGRGSSGCEVHMFGFESDLERVDVLFTSLLVQASFGLATVQPSRWGESTITYRKSWVWGFTNSVRARLEAAENRAKREADDPSNGSSTDLVLADRKAIVERRAHEAYPRAKEGRRTAIKGSGYRDGQAAGNRADLGGTRIGRSGGSPNRSIGQ